MQTEKIVFGGGCFWCTEAVFKNLKGVVSVVSGYAGGTVSNPTYEQVSEGNTGHAEVVLIEYNPQEVELKTLLVVFFATHDPTTLNRQGADVGEQYRSAVFYTKESQRDIVINFINEINNSSKDGGKVVTEVKPLDAFYEAEKYHQNYFENNPNNPYCAVVINPKLEKVQKLFADLLKQ
jgi:peptide-methionine (S)-S-oxide reductase